MQLSLLTALSGQMPIQATGTGAVTLEGEGGEGFASLLGQLWAASAEGSPHIALASSTPDASPLPLQLQIQMTEQLGGMAEASDVWADLAGLLRSLLAQGEGGAEGLASLAGWEADGGEDLLATLREWLQDSEGQSDSEAGRLLMDLLEDMPQAQQQVLVQWLGTGKGLPETASQLQGLLQGGGSGLAADPSDTDGLQSSPEVQDHSASPKVRRESSPDVERARMSLGFSLDAAKGGEFGPELDVEMDSMLGSSREAFSGLTQDPALGRLGMALPSSPSSGATTGIAGGGGSLSGLGQAFSAIQVPVGQRDWGGALGERVLWMVNQEVQSAEVRLNPPQLGPLEIRVAVQNDQASVTFTTPHALTREALEGALPRLREMLAESQLNLANVNVNVSQQDGGGPRGNGRESGANGHGGGWQDDLDGMTAEESQTVPTTRLSAGLVDDFA